MRKRLVDILREATSVAPLQVGTMRIENVCGRLLFFEGRYLYAVSEYGSDFDVDYFLRNYTYFTWAQFRQKVRNALRKRGTV